MFWFLTDSPNPGTRYQSLSLTALWTLYTTSTILLSRMFRTYVSRMHKSCNSSMRNKHSSIQRKIPLAGFLDCSIHIVKLFYLFANRQLVVPMYPEGSVVKNQYDSPAKIWNSLYTDSLSRGRFNFYVFWDGSAVLSSNDTLGASVEQRKRAVAEFQK